MRSSLLVLVVLVLGCAGPRPASQPPVHASKDAGESTDFFCRYRLNPWYLPGAELRLKRGEAPFASFEWSHRAGVELTMPHGPASEGMNATFTSGWVTFRAHYLPTKPFQVATRVPLRFGQVLTFEEGTKVSTLGSDAAGRMIVERELPKHYRPAMELRTTIRCEDTTIGNDFRRTKRSDGEQPRRVHLAAKVDIPVSATPSGAAEGHLRFDDEEAWSRQADLLEEKPDFVRIQKRLWPGIVEGWIPRAHLALQQDEEKLSGILSALGGLGARGEGRGTPNYPRCASEVALFVERGGQLARVGEVRKKAAVLAKERLPGWTVVTLPELDWIRLAPGARWALTNEDVGRCLPTADEGSRSAQ